MRQQFDSSACKSGPQGNLVPRYRKLARRLAAAALALAATQAVAGPAIANAAAKPSAAAASAAKATDHTKTVTFRNSHTATITWRDYGNGFIQLKSGRCQSDPKFFICRYVLRADGGRTSFHTWETGPGSEEFRNGSYTVAKSRHPYVKIFDKDGIFGTSTGYVHLY